MISITLERAEHLDASDAQHIRHRQDASIAGEEHALHIEDIGIPQRSVEHIEDISITQYPGEHIEDINEAPEAGRCLVRGIATENVISVCLISERNRQTSTHPEFVRGSAEHIEDISIARNPGEHIEDINAIPELGRCNARGVGNEYIEDINGILSAGDQQI